MMGHLVIRQVDGTDSNDNSKENGDTQCLGR